MKGYAYCTKCKKIVEIAELYISNTVLNTVSSNRSYKSLSVRIKPLIFPVPQILTESISVKQTRLPNGLANRKSRQLTRNVHPIRNYLHRLQGAYYARQLFSI